MRKIDSIAKEKFNGDMSKTLEYLLYEADGDFSPYIDELTQAEAKMVMQFLERDAIKHYGSEENYYDEFKKQHLFICIFSMLVFRNSPPNTNTLGRNLNL